LLKGGDTDTIFRYHHLLKVALRTGASGCIKGGVLKRVWRRDCPCFTPRIDTCRGDWQWMHDTLEHMFRDDGALL
jgi:hypothetical protein